MKAVYENEVEEIFFNGFAVDGVKVFIGKKLKMDEDVLILQHARLPFSKPSFGVQGVRI
ncbi:MAG: hypothetical protein AB9844_06305 [Clostridiaceae bacterium]